MKAIERCDHPLLHGRSCCHVKGHGLYSRHSHTWQLGDARYVDIDDKIIDMETGEVVGYSGGLGQQIIEALINERRPESIEDKQARARRTLELQYGFDIPDPLPTPHTIPPKGYAWHYEGDTKAFGTDNDGHDVAFDFTSGKTQRIYSVNQRREAVEYARRFGDTKASRKFDIPAKTISSWKGRSRAK